MSNSKHTPGPWVQIGHKQQSVKESTYLIMQEFGTSKTNICTLIQPLGMSDDELLSNAKLIATAPELLAALIYAKAFISSFVDCSEEDTEFINNTLNKIL